MASGFWVRRPVSPRSCSRAAVRPALIAWSDAKTAVFRDGKTLLADTGLEGLRNVVDVVPGDFDNDGLPDLCVLTTTGGSLYRNVKGKFQKQADLPQRPFRQAVWMDYDHDYDLDLFLLGDQSVVLRNNGEAGFGDETGAFPFVQGHALSGAALIWNRTLRASIWPCLTRTAPARSTAICWEAPIKPSR